MRRLLLACAALVLPLTVLLFAQWPLRDLVQAGSREANDLAQVVFALYMAVAVTAASVDRAHLCAGHGESDTAPAPRWQRRAVLACTAPWALFVLWTSAPGVWQSVRQLERFGETLDGGYFLIRVALWLLAALVLLHAAVDAFRGRTA